MSNPKIIDKVIRFHLEEFYDYTTNSGFEGSYPDGKDVEVFTMDTLTRAAKLATKPHDREHVCTFMKNRNMFRVGQVYSGASLWLGKGRKYSVDTLEDYEFVKEELECLPALKNYSPGH